MELIKRVNIFKWIDISIDLLLTRGPRHNKTLYLLPGINIHSIKGAGNILPVLIIELCWLYCVIYINIFKPYKKMDHEQCRKI